MLVDNVLFEYKVAISRLFCYLIVISCLTALDNF